MNHCPSCAPSPRGPLSPGPAPGHECWIALPEVPRPGETGPEELESVWVFPLGEADIGERSCVPPAAFPS